MKKQCSYIFLMDPDEYAVWAVEIKLFVSHLIIQELEESVSAPLSWRLFAPTK
jgi:hypothetical protein